MKLSVDEDLVIPDKDKTLAEGALAPWSNSKYYTAMLEQACKALKIPIDKPYKKLTKRQKDLILNGSKGKKIKFHLEGDFGVNDTVQEFEGILNNISRRYHHPMSKLWQNQPWNRTPCPPI